MECRNLSPLALLAAIIVSLAAMPLYAQAPASPPAATQPAAAGPVAAGPLGIVKFIPGAGEARWDLLAADPQTRRVYVAQTDHVAVFDVEKGAAVGEVTGLSGAHGVALVPDRNLGFATSGRDNTVSVFDLKTLKTLQTIKVGQKPDAILYDPASQRVFVFNAGSGDASIVDPAALDEAPVTLAIGGAMEIGVADGAGHVYVNVEDKSETVAIDSKQQKVLAHWSVAPGEGPTGLAMDTAHRRLFAGCANKLMVILDADQGKVVGTAPVGSGVDGMAFDPQLELAVCPNGRDGTVTAMREGPAGQFTVVQTLPTARGARTITEDPKAHQFYLPCTMAEGGQTRFGLLVLGLPGSRPVPAPVHE